MRKPKRGNLKWNFQEIKYLKNAWGNKSLKTIARKLQRTTTAIQLKAKKVGLKRSTNYGEYITFNQFIILLNKPTYNKYNKKLLKAGFPLKHITIISKKIKVIYLDEFWDWLEKNKHLVDLQFTEKGDLGIEPDWVYYKRDADKRFAEYSPRNWTKEEDARLISLLNQFRYGYREISIFLKRTEGAIKRRMIDLNLISRPIKAENHNPWKKSEIDTVKDLYNKGYNPCIIAEYIDRSAIAINGLLERYKYFKNER